MKKNILTYSFLFSILCVSNWSFPRTLEEIIESGYIQVAVREKRTVYEKKVSSSGKIEYSGLHYQLVQEFAKSLKVTPSICGYH